MDSSDSGNTHRLVKSQFFASGAFHTEQEKLPCPRCESNDTKFCYYNNYNLSQPRYYCKSCRRYWTRGGALRDVPVGGAPRKGTKRPRTKTTTMTITTPSSSSSSSSSVSPQEEENPSPILTISTQSFSVPPLIPVRSSLNVPPMAMGGLSTYLNTPGVFSWNGFGYSGFNDLGNSIWPLTLPGMVDIDTSGGNVATPWELGGAGDVVYSGDNECFGLPELSMSAARKGVK